MILHSVYLGLRSDVADTELAAVMDGLAGLVGEIDGFTGFDHGPNIDAEGKSPEASYGFLCCFSVRAALDRYAVDARHRAFGAQLVVLCDRADRVKVYDIESRAS